MPSSAQTPESTPPVDWELMLRLEMTARQVKGLFSHRAGSNETGSRDVETSNACAADPFDVGHCLTLISQMVLPGMEDMSVVERRRRLRTDLIRVSGGRALLMPRALQEPEERYFSDAMAALHECSDHRSSTPFTVMWLLLHPEHLERLYRLSAVALSLSMPASTMMASMSEHLDRDAGERVSG